VKIGLSFPSDVPLLLVQESPVEEEPPVTGNAVAAEIVITRRSALGVAPEAFVFEITDFVGFDTTGPGAGEVYDPRHHELEYYWTFGDTYDFVAPVNALAEHKGSGVSYGPMVSHTYRAAGTYQPTCVIVEPATGKTCTARLSSTTMTVGNPDTLFSGTNTVFMSPSGSFGNAPAGASTITSGNVNATLEAQILGSDTTPKRLMLNRGENYTFSGQRLGDQTARRVPSLHIVAGPSGAAKPAIKATGGFGWVDSQTTGNGTDKDFVLQNLVWQGPWDGTTATGAIADFVNINDYSPNLTLIDGSEISGAHQGIYANGTTTIDHRVIVLNDTKITDWGLYGVAANNLTAIVVTGCHIGHNPDGWGKGPSGMMLAPIRYYGTGQMIMSNSDLFSNSGSTSISGGYGGFQGCIRFNVNGVEGTKGNIQTTTMEGGFRVFEALLPGDVTTSSTMNLLFERNYLLGSWQTSQFIATSATGMTIRNNTFCRPNAAQLAGVNNPGPVLGMDDARADTLCLASEINMYNNTLVNLMEPESYNSGEPDYRWTGGIGGSGEFTNVTVNNNVQHSPNLTTPKNADAPFVMTDQFTPRNDGYRTDASTKDTSCATPTTGSTPLMRPDTGSAAIGDALNGPVAYYDFSGNQRPQYPSRGAFEMS